MNTKELEMLKEKLKALVIHKRFRKTPDSWEATASLGRWSGPKLDLAAWSRAGVWDFGIECDLGGGDGDDKVGASIGLGFVRARISLEWRAVIGPAVEWLATLGRQYPAKRRTEIGLHSDPDCGVIFRVSLFESVHDWSRKASFLAQGKAWRVDLADVIFGKVEYQEAEKEKEMVILKLPEGEYEAKVKTWKCRWVRPMLPTPAWLYRASVDVDVGVENHHHKGPLFGTCFAVSEHRLSAEQVANRFVGDVLKERLKYGGTWMAEHRQPKRGAQPPAVGDV